MAKVPSISSRIVAIDTRSAVPPPKTAEPIYTTREYAMAEAAMQVTPCHPSNVKYRMIEALEGLDGALDGPGAMRQ